MNGIRTPQPQMLMLVAALAVAGQLALTASGWLLPAVSEYRLVADNVSELVLGRYGFLQTAAFLVAGVGVLALVPAVRALTAGARGSQLGTILLAVWGAGALLTAAFPTDEINRPADVWSQSIAGTVHVVVALVAFPAVVVAMLVLTRTFAQDRRWRSLTVWSGIFASGALSLFFAQGEGPRVGLMQRLFLALVSAWIVMVALRIRSIATGAGAEAR